MLIRGAAFLVMYNPPYLLSLSLLTTAGSLVVCCHVRCCCIVVFTVFSVVLDAWLHVLCYCAGSSALFGLAAGD